MLRHPSPLFALATLLPLCGAAASPVGAASAPVGAAGSPQMPRAVYWGGCLPNTPENLRTLDTFIPTTHIFYELMERFAACGLTPEGPARDYGAHIPFKEREWAEITTAQLAKMELLAGVGAPVFDGWRDNLGNRPLSYIEHISGPFMTQLGIDEAWSEAAAKVADDYLESGRPQGVLVPLTADPGRFHGPARETGRKAARQAWVRGKRSLLTTQPLPEPAPPTTALQWRAVPADIPPAERDQFAVGYNRETWRLLREHGGEAGSWLSIVSDPENAWRRGKEHRLRLERCRDHAAARSGSATFRLAPTGDGGTSLTRVSTNGKAIPQGMPFLTHLTSPVELKMGPPGTGVYLLRTPVDFRIPANAPGGRDPSWRRRERKDRESRHRLYVLDLGSGAVLNAVAAP